MYIERKKDDRMVEVKARIPKELHDKLHVLKATTGRTIRDMVGEAVEDWIKRDAPNLVSDDER